MDFEAYQLKDVPLDPPLIFTIGRNLQSWADANVFPSSLP